MTTERIILDLNQENIKNICTDSFGKFIAITTQNNIIGNDFRIELNRDYHFPIVRILDDEKILIVDDNEKLSENAIIFDYSGNVILKFYAGIGIENILTTKRKIIISYFDEGILGKNGPNNDGISVFDYFGNQKYGYKSTTNNTDFIDCYCLTTNGNKKVLFYGYNDFIIRELNLETYEIIELETPVDFLGANSMSVLNENIIFYSSYKNKTSFFVWNTKLNKIEKIESNEKGLKATNNGTFYSFDNKSFTLYKPME